MNRQEYLSRLNAALPFLDQDARTTAVNFYAEVLDDRVENGMTEEEATAGMASAEEIAAQLREEGDLQQNVSADSSAKKEKKHEVLSNLFEALTGKQAEQPEMKEFVETFRPEEVRKLTLSLRNREVRICSGEGALATVRYDAPADQPLNWTVENGEAPLDDPWVERSLTVHLLNYTFRADNGKSTLHNLINGIACSNLTVTVTLPAAQMEKIKAVTSNAAIELENLTQVRRFKVRTSNGLLRMTDVTAQEITGRTSNGSIQMTDCQFEEKADLTTSNGSIQAENITAGRFTLTTSNGRAVARRISAAERLDMTTSNSRIEAEITSAGAVALTTSNASVNAALPGHMADWQITSRTSNAHNGLPAFQEGEKPLCITTSNGAFNASFAG